MSGEERRQEPHPWEDLEPDAPRADGVAWALLIRAHHVVVVVEPAAAPDMPPGVHLALSVSYELADEVLLDNGWRPRSWLPRSWGRVARVDVEYAGGTR